MTEDRKKRMLAALADYLRKGPRRGSFFTPLTRARQGKAGGFVLPLKGHLHPP